MKKIPIHEESWINYILKPGDNFISDENSITSQSAVRGPFLSEKNS